LSDIVLWILLKQQPSRLLPPEDVAAYPIGLFPAVFTHDAEWIYRTNHFGHLVGDLAEETLRTVIRYMNA
jgi:hypothetical protein